MLEFFKKIYNIICNVFKRNNPPIIEEPIFLETMDKEVLLHKLELFNKFEHLSKRPKFNSTYEEDFVSTTVDSFNQERLDYQESLDNQAFLDKRALQTKSFLEERELLILECFEARRKIYRSLIRGHAEIDLEASSEKAKLIQKGIEEKLEFEHDCKNEEYKAFMTLVTGSDNAIDADYDVKIKEFDKSILIKKANLSKQVLLEEKAIDYIYNKSNADFSKKIAHEDYEKHLEELYKKYPLAKQSAYVDCEKDKLFFRSLDKKFAIEKEQVIASQATLNSKELVICENESIISCHSPLSTLEMFLFKEFVIFSREKLISDKIELILYQNKLDRIDYMRKFSLEKGAIKLEYDKKILYIESCLNKSEVYLFFNIVDYNYSIKALCENYLKYTPDAFIVLDIPKDINTFKFLEDVSFIKSIEDDENTKFYWFFLNEELFLMNNLFFLQNELSALKLDLYLYEKMQLDIFMLFPKKDSDIFPIAKINYSKYFMSLDDRIKKLKHNMDSCKIDFRENFDKIKENSRAKALFVEKIDINFKDKLDLIQDYRKNSLSLHLKDIDKLSQYDLNLWNVKFLVTFETQLEIDRRSINNILEEKAFNVIFLKDMTKIASNVKKMHINIDRKHKEVKSILDDTSNFIKCQNKETNVLVDAISVRHYYTKKCLDPYLEHLVYNNIKNNPLFQIDQKSNDNPPSPEDQKSNDNPLFQIDQKSNDNPSSLEDQKKKDNSLLSDFTSSGSSNVVNNNNFFNTIFLEKLAILIASTSLPELVIIFILLGFLIGICVKIQIWFKK